MVLKNFESSGILMTEQMDELMLEKSVPRISRVSKAEITGYGSYVHGIEGDLRFRAPEVMLGKSYDSKADSWSFGVIMFHLLAGRLPFGENTKDLPSDTKSIEEAIQNYEGFDQLQRMVISRGHSAQSVDLLKKLMHKDPKQRLPISVALRHKWFSMKLDVPPGRSLEPKEKDNSKLKIRKELSRCSSISGRDKAKMTSKRSQSRGLALMNF